MVNDYYSKSVPLRKVLGEVDDEQSCFFLYSVEQNARQANGHALRLQNSPYFAYSSTREQSNKRSGMRLKTESETGV